MNNAAKKKLAKKLYINTGLSKKDIAEQLGVNRNTISNWVKINNWDAIKESQNITKSELLQQAYRQLKAINQTIEDEHDNIPPKHLSDAKGVVRKEIEQFSDNPLHIYIDVFNELTIWVQRNSSAHQIPLFELCNTFIEEKAKEQSR